MKDLPSEEELFAGRMKDGSRPPLYSTELYDKHVVDGFGRPLPPQLREKTPVEKSALELKIAIEERRLRNYDRIEAAGNHLMDLGFDILAGGRESVPQADESAQPETQKGSDPLAGDDQPRASGGDDNPAESSASKDVSDDQPDPDPRATGGQSPAARLYSIPEPRTPRPKARPVRGGKAFVPESPTKPQPDDDEKLRRAADRADAIVNGIKAGTTRGPSRETIRKLSARDATNLIYTGARLLASVTDKRAECAHNLVELTMQQDLKEAFYWDRAHAVVAATLLHLDEEFEEVGFGSWMPFKFPDQWLMFCGVLRRVLVANGLMHADDPEQYRRFFEETEYPVPEIADIDERIKWWKTPRNWSTLWLNRGAETMEILKQRLTDEVWDPTTEFGGTRAPPQSP